jgi:hypothetical protein
MIEDNLEPDSTEFESVNDFFEAIAAGEGAQVASALRALESLEGFPLEFLADLLDDAPLYRQIFPRRLKLAKRSRGRPKKKLDALKLKSLELGSATAFFKRIAAGKAPEAAKALRTLKSLHGAQLKLLADLFDVKTELPEGIYWRLKLAAPHAGTTVDSLSRAAKDFGWTRVITDALAAHRGEKMEAVKHELMTQTGKSRTTVTEKMKNLGIAEAVKSK